MKRFSGFAAVLLLGGCYTVEGLRARAPAHSGEFSVGYRRLAACTARDPELQRFNASLVVDEDAMNATITAAPSLEVVAREVAPNRTAAEVRSISSAWGSTPMADAAWGAVQRCGATAT